MTPAEQAPEDQAPAGGRPRRVLVALTGAPGPSALDPVARLARRLEADLLGLFMEDPRLAALAEHTGVAVRSTLLPARAPDPGLLRRALRARLAESRRALEEAGHRLSVRTEFQIFQGAGMTAVLARAETTDMVVMGVQGARTPPGGVVVVFDGSDGAARAFDVAGALTGPGGGRLTVVLATPRMDRARAWETDLRARLAGRDIAIDGIEMPAPTLSAVARLARHKGASLLVLDRASPLLGDEAEMDRAGVSVLLV